MSSGSREGVLKCPQCSQYVYGGWVNAADDLFICATCISDVMRLSYTTSRKFYLCLSIINLIHYGLDVVGDWKRKTPSSMFFAHTVDDWQATLTRTIKWIEQHVGVSGKKKKKKKKSSSKKRKRAVNKITLPDPDTPSEPEMTPNSSESERIPNINDMLMELRRIKPMVDRLLVDMEIIVGILDDD